MTNYYSYTLIFGDEEHSTMQLFDKPPPQSAVNSTEDIAIRPSDIPPPLSSKPPPLPQSATAKSNVTKTRDDIIIELRRKDLVVKIVNDNIVKNYHIKNDKLNNNNSNNNNNYGLYNYYLDKDKDINLTEKINIYTVIYNEIINQNDGKDTLPNLNNDYIILYGKFCNGKNELKLVIPEDFEHDKDNINRQVNKCYSEKCKV
tara:strand:- start:111 stop:716 length:606 start_codon:yes stop_codon:yes gene_type:complete